jgi:bacillithiol system protein YtxJ
MTLFTSIFGDSENNNSNTSKINWIELTDLGQLNEIMDLSHEQPVIIFKHSTRCSISRMALKQLENEFDLEGSVTPYFLDLINHRDISNEIATRFDVYHQSPQLLLIKEGKSIYDASHSDIDAVELKVRV